MAGKSVQPTYDDTTAKHVYTSAAVSVYKMLLVRGYDISSKINILNRTNTADDIALELWGSTSHANFEDIRLVFDYDYDRKMMPLVNQVCKQMKPYYGRVVHAADAPQRKIATVFIAGSGSEKDTSFASSTGTKANSNLFSYLIDEYSGNEDRDSIDIILITEDKLTSSAANTLENMKGDPGLPRIWHFRYNELIKFQPEATMMPYQTLYTDPDMVAEIMSKYTKDNSMMTYCLEDDMTNRIYGSKLGDLYFIERYNPDPSSIARRIPYLRLVSTQVMPKY